MRKWIKEVYRYSDGYYPRIYEDQGRLLYYISVDSGAVSLGFKFTITDQDFQILKADAYRFKILYFILFHSIQNTFGIGHPQPRKFTQEEFDKSKNMVMHSSDSELEEFLSEFMKVNNFDEAYLEIFLKE